METVIITKKLAENLFHYLGRQPCAGVFGMYAELATAISKSTESSSRDAPANKGDKGHKED